MAFLLRRRVVEYLLLVDDYHGPADPKQRWSSGSLCARLGLDSLPSRKRWINTAGGDAPPTAPCTPSSTVRCASVVHAKNEFATAPPRRCGDAKVCLVYRGWRWRSDRCSSYAFCPWFYVYGSRRSVLFHAAQRGETIPRKDARDGRWRLVVAEELRPI